MLATIASEVLQDLNENHPETGMNFQIVRSPKGLVAIIGDGTALPLYVHPGVYDLVDLIEGEPIPTERTNMPLEINEVINNRADAQAAMLSAIVSSGYTGATGAFPLISSETLPANITFYRYLSSPHDPRYVGGSLTAGTYLTTSRDRTYANSGFASVGRYALPMPLPSTLVIEYELPKGTLINIGTVAPLFGQAGGGVEVQLPNAAAATPMGLSPLAAY